MKSKLERIHSPRQRIPFSRRAESRRNDHLERTEGGERPRHAEGEPLPSPSGRHCLPNLRGPGTRLPFHLSRDAARRRNARCDIWRGARRRRISGARNERNEPREIA